MPERRWALKDADVGAHINNVRAGVNHHGVHRGIGKGGCGGAGEVAPTCTRIRGLPHVSWAASETHHSDVGSVACGVGGVDGNAGDRKLIGIDAAATGAVQGHVLESGTHSGNRGGIRGDPNIAADRKRGEIVRAEAVSGGIDYLRATRVGGASGRQGANQVDFAARAGSGPERIEIEAQHGERAARSRSAPHPAGSHQHRSWSIADRECRESKKIRRRLRRLLLLTTTVKRLSLQFTPDEHS